MPGKTFDPGGGTPMIGGQMNTISPPRLLKADVLREMKPAVLAAFLAPHAAYFSGLGFDPAAVASGRADLDALAAALACPGLATPPELVEQIELLDLVAGAGSALNFEDAHHELLRELREQDDCAADLAVKILLRAPWIAQREFNRQAMSARRSLVSFRVRPGMPFHGVSDARIEAFRRFVSPWFAANARSAACAVHHECQAGGHGFVVRHGDPIRRIGTLGEDGSREPVLLRPERADIARFRPASGEWQVSGLGTRIQELYRQAFGAAFHGSPDALAFSKRYSLEPLRDGPPALACDLNSTVQSAELASIKAELPGGQTLALDGAPVFAALDALDPRILAEAALIEAVISFKLALRRTRPRVRICLARDTILGDNAHPAIDAWLVEHGFANDSTRLLASA